MWNTVKVEKGQTELSGGQSPGILKDTALGRLLSPVLPRNPLRVAGRVKASKPETTGRVFTSLFHNKDESTFQNFEHVYLPQKNQLRSHKCTTQNKQ